MSRARLLQRNALCACGIFRRVDVEKGIDRLIRPVGDGDTMPRGPDLDLAHVLFDERLAQIFAQRQRPQTYNGMTPLAGARTGERHARAHLPPRLVQALHEVVGQERAVARYADDPLDAVLLP